MRLPAQTYLVALQCLAVVGGTLLVAGVVEGAEDLLVHPESAALGVARLLGRYGLFLLLLPAAWAFLTIRAERSHAAWASKGLTVLSGTLLLAALAVLFAWAAIRAALAAFS